MKAVLPEAPAKTRVFAFRKVALAASMMYTAPALGCEVACADAMRYTPVQHNSEEYLQLDIMLQLASKNALQWPSNRRCVWLPLSKEALHTVPATIISMLIVIVY